MKHVSISIGEQTLRLLDDDEVLCEYVISSAAMALVLRRGVFVRRREGL